MKQRFGSSPEYDARGNGSTQYNREPAPLAEKGFRMLTTNFLLSQGVKAYYEATD
ncbi:hypothetical protein GCM10011340_16420 [Roseivirga thermotolerans]|uniref:Uncharacterized protein n=1 Tax=Roseivirga thermotolerans TaxID=1758176 RepID=A0ABQ3I837_9BACT|nr:hypothetical protein GCM10011340_16420 [Roseivirga thermotolerans]